MRGVREIVVGVDVVIQLLAIQHVLADGRGHTGDEFRTAAPLFVRIGEVQLNGADIQLLVVGGVRVPDCEVDAAAD